MISLAAKSTSEKEVLVKWFVIFQIFELKNEKHNGNTVKLRETPVRYLIPL